MPYRYVDPEVFHEHGGVLVWHVYRDGTDEPLSYWFTTNPATADDSYAHGQGGHFDARILAGRWSDTPNVKQWDEFWTTRFKSEHDAMISLITAAIDEGRLPK